MPKLVRITKGNHPPAEVRLGKEDNIYFCCDTE